MNKILTSVAYGLCLAVPIALAGVVCWWDGRREGRREGWHEARLAFASNNLSAEERVRRHEMAVYGVLTTTLSAGGREVGTATSVVNLN